MSVPVYSSIAAATTAGSPAGEAYLSGGDMAVLWLGPPPEDKLPKDAAGEEGFQGGQRQRWCLAASCQGFELSSIRMYVTVQLPEVGCCKGCQQVADGSPSCAGCKKVSTSGTRSTCLLPVTVQVYQQAGPSGI